MIAVLPAATPEVVHLRVIPVATTLPVSTIAPLPALPVPEQLLAVASIWITKPRTMKEVVPVLPFAKTAVGVVPAKTKTQQKIYLTNVEHPVHLY